MSLFSNLSTLFGTEVPNRETRAKNSSNVSPKSDATGKEKVRNRPKRRRRKNPNRKPISAVAVTNQEVVREATARAREILVEAKAEALSIRSKAEKDAQEDLKKVEQQQRSLDDKLNRVEQKLTILEQKEENLSNEKQKLTQRQQDIEEQKKKVIAELEEVSGLTTEEAKDVLFSRLEETMSRQLSVFIREKEEQAHAEAEEKVRDILVDAMKHGATDEVPEYTVSVVELPNEETKGKIIGKAGRNINAFERRTGVDLDLDMSPTEVRLSCFDPVRREVARRSLEKLIKDGRIQPTRIEEVVDKVEKDLDKVLLEAGKKLCQDVGVYNLPVELMRLIGRFKYRFSYGQNLISHTLEETKIGIKIAHELGVDVNIVKMGCLLHDIGKVSDEVEGSHVELGITIAKRFNLPKPVIDCIAQHHEDEPFSGPEQMVVYIADAISGARPGARYENYEGYVKRLQQLEEIAMQYPEVRQAYAIQAGREVRVLLEPEKSKDNDVTVLSVKIRDEIKEKMTYPGTVTVTVIRELRGQKIAK
ncbi:MAG: ribonuclease Y [Candidatus Pacebacteria bacterium]|nr:ribonuclease Y [Candidatus Paceibacterota bacterium]PIR63165.1 MAG: ribonuclease Y [Candidatus Pacebacteria bacterium CG10_big_fil_rev_8_21_14_0_10_40_26]PIZ78195.1 MAG: ribonuclease Y [Candidatus Pacebacteria bacterium CG_4_10_14_0_2_um_filter_40_20]PJA68760.1 MAG: ribonuclease Y [Candidatus Pacebacteria bacterium CG_4_9_14_3_um_filter_40_12]PJC41700.1 MAG: ribonuclease Y [Candidatus Pacebacteria bacterium CG_4_9_14_0_2_um_filter_40_15]